MHQFYTPFECSTYPASESSFNDDMSMPPTPAPQPNTHLSHLQPTLESYPWDDSAWHDIAPRTIWDASLGRALSPMSSPSSSSGSLEDQDPLYHPFASDNISEDFEFDMFPGHGQHHDALTNPNHDIPSLSMAGASHAFHAMMRHQVECRDPHYYDVTPNYLFQPADALAGRGYYHQNTMADVRCVPLLGDPSLGMTWSDGQRSPPDAYLSHQFLLTSPYAYAAFATQRNVETRPTIGLTHRSDTFPDMTILLSGLDKLAIGTRPSPHPEAEAKNSTSNTHLDLRGYPSSGHRVTVEREVDPRPLQSKRSQKNHLRLINPSIDTKRERPMKLINKPIFPHAAMSQSDQSSRVPATPPKRDLRGYRFDITGYRLRKGESPYKPQKNPRTPRRPRSSSNRSSTTHARGPSVALASNLQSPPRPKMQGRKFDLSDFKL